MGAARHSGGIQIAALKEGVDVAMATMKAVLVPQAGGASVGLVG